MLLYTRLRGQNFQGAENEKVSLWIFVPIQGEVAKFAATLKEYPPVSGGSLSGGLSYKSLQIQQALDMLNNLPGGQT